MASNDDWIFLVENIGTAFGVQTEKNQPKNFNLIRTVPCRQNKGSFPSVWIWTSYVRFCQSKCTIWLVLHRNNFWSRSVSFHFWSVTFGRKVSVMFNLKSGTLAPSILNRVLIMMIFFSSNVFKIKGKSMSILLHIDSASAFVTSLSMKLSKIGENIIFLWFYSKDENSLSLNLFLVQYISSSSQLIAARVDENLNNERPTRASHFSLFYLSIISFVFLIKNYAIFTNNIEYRILKISRISDFAKSIASSLIVAHSISLMEMLFHPSVKCSVLNFSTILDVSFVKSEPDIDKELCRKVLSRFYII